MLMAVILVLGDGKYADIRDGSRSDLASFLACTPSIPGMILLRRLTKYNPVSGQYGSDIA